MMTPQEVASRAFPRATLGGYNMGMVDEFLDLVTEDYTTLYNDNAILKNKLKVLSDTVEDYRATDEAMRKTLLAAQRMAESMVSDAEAKKAELVREAEEAARRRIGELQAEIAAEEYRLKAAREATAAYVAELAKLHEAQQQFLAQLGELAPKADEDEARVDAAVSEIEEAMSQITAADEPTRELPNLDAVAEVEEEPVEEEPAEEVEEEVEEETPASARFENLRFGKDYEIE